jgi:SAM-dependent methyltransferase
VIAVEDVSSIVARQYDAFAYPEPFSDIAAQIARGYYQLGDPSLYGPLLWPRGRPPGRMRILVAGCGTVQAAYTAYCNRDDEVIGVDLSESALAHERFLQERHGLSNLNLYRGNLLDIASIGRDFDVILCSGVLHHMEDPAAGLAALRDVLAPDGVMVLMVYGQTCRVGVYMLQDAFRRMGLRQDAASIAHARAILRELPERHCVQTYVRAAKELEHDSAFVDTFLHPQDRAYTVPQLLEWIEGAGLVFKNWVDGFRYWRNGAWGPDSAIARAVDALPPREHWAVVESLRQTAGTHVFTVRHPHSGRSLEIDFTSSDWPRYTPHRSPAFVKAGPGRYQRGPHVLWCSPPEEIVIDGVDGKRTIAEIIAHPGLAAIPTERREGFARAYFEHLWKLGHMMIAVPPEDADR